MFYKEWKSARVKVLLWLGLYSFFAFIYCFFATSLSLNGWLRHFNPATLAVTNFTYNDYLSSLSFTDPLYQGWLAMFFFLTIINAVLGGIDAVSEEKDKQTIGFLLSRPVKRSRIYTAKLIVNNAGLWVASSLASLPVWLVDVTGPKPFGLKLVFLGTIVILLLGTTVICLTALISIFANNAIQTLMISLAALLVLYLIWYNLAHNSNIPINTYSAIGLVFYSLTFSGLALALYCAGVSCFAKKEF